MRTQFTSTCLLLALQTGSAFTFRQSFSVATIAPSTSRLNAGGLRSEEQTEQSFRSRRSFMAAAGALISQGVLLPTNVVKADDGDLTSQLFNPDGSLKDGEVEEVKFRTVEIAWETASSDKYLTNIDGKNGAGTESGSGIRLSYKIPEKWTQKDDGYFDKSATDFAKTCQRITVYKAPGTVSPDRLTKAATIGIAEALLVTDELQVLKGADLISGRSRRQGDVKFYDFDLASAPKTCGDSSENLGLGFCPFDTIYLLSAGVINDAMYVIALECNKSEWKVASSELKRLRSSFAFDA